MLDAAAVISYILPIRAASPVSAELVEYVRSLPAYVEVIVVDGSSAPIFRDLHTRCGPAVRHVAPDRNLRQCANGKVGGVITGSRLASHEKIIVADDDVRYDEQSLAAMSRALDGADAVRPQNYFDPLPWHACL